VIKLKLVINNIKANLPIPHKRFSKSFFNNLAISALVFGVVLAGFWGPQIVRAMGIPIDPARFTAVYFQIPEIVAKGIAAGDLVVFGITNGDRLAHKISWQMKRGNTTFQSGVEEIAGNSDKLIAKQSTGAAVGSRLEIYAGDLKTPISVWVVG
jgi:hypothetical protein